MRSLFHTLCLATFFALLLPAEAPAQPTRFLQDIFGFGEEIPIARFLLHQEGEELCLTLGVQPGPKSLHPKSFLISRRVTPGGKGHNGRLKFAFAKTPDREEEGLQVWVTCVEATGPVPEAKKDAVVVKVMRGAENWGDKPEFFIDYPPPGESFGLDLRRDPAGGLAAQNFVKVEGTQAATR